MKCNLQKVFCLIEDCSAAFIGQSGICLEVIAKSMPRVRELILSCLHDNHPITDISHFSIINRDPNHIAREGTDAIHIRKLNAPLNRNISEVGIPQVFNNSHAIKVVHYFMSGQPVSKPIFKLESLAIVLDFWNLENR